MAIFDFIQTMPFYAEKTRDAARLNARHRYIIEPHLTDIDGARVLDLASHDGRWPFAFAQAGAREVIGIEGRAELIREFDSYPWGPERERITLRQGDINDVLPDLVARGERFDVVSVLGIYYHITTQYAVLAQIRALSPRLVLIDGEFLNNAAPVIRLVQEDTRKSMNSLPYFQGQDFALKGVPSRGAMELMASSLGFRIEWLDWSRLPKAERTGVRDYFRDGPQTRATCVLRPLHRGPLNAHRAPGPTCGQT